MIRPTWRTRLTRWWRTLTAWRGSEYETLPSYTDLKSRATRPTTGAE